MFKPSGLDCLKELIERIDFGFDFKCISTFNWFVYVEKKSLFKQVQGPTG